MGMYFLKKCKGSIFIFLWENVPLRVLCTQIREYLTLTHNFNFVNFKDTLAGIREGARGRPK